MFNLSPAIAAIDWAFSGTVVLVGLVVVFAVLLILVAFCSITGKIFSSSKKDKKKADVAPALKAVSAPAPVVEDGIGDDVVAAISAAIACIMGEGVPFTVKSISKKKTVASASGRPAWSAAGIADNTRPF